jgi:hypothetical protein
MEIAEVVLSATNFIVVLYLITLFINLFNYFYAKSLEVKFRKHVVTIEDNAYLVSWIYFLAVMNLVRILHFLVSDILKLTNVENDPF